MKNLMKLFMTIFVLSMSLFITNPVKAAPMVIYDFSSYQVPEGQPSKLEVDDTTIAIMQQNPVYISAFVNALAARYDSPTAVINKTLETAYLTSVVNCTAPAGVHIPSYISAVSNELVTTNTDKTYVDVNITTQTLTLYVNGTATVVTPIVTGNVNKGHGTPTGNFSVRYMQKNRTLIGKNNSYRSFVSRWIRITDSAIGIHDASWRSSFGGNIYLTNGSHGCINVPSNIINSIYDVVEIGTPVYVHL